MENLEKELVAWAEKHDRERGVMPLIQDIKRSGDYMIFHSITKYHGGKNSVAKRLGWRVEKRNGRGYWSLKENIREQLWPYLDCEEAEGGSGGEEEEVCTLPTKMDLVKLGRQDLVGAIDRVGGFKTLAKDLNLKMKAPGRKPLYPELRDWETYKRQLELWMMARRENDLAQQRMPRMSEMFEDGAKDLHYATKKYHGGWKRAADKLGWSLKH